MTDTGETRVTRSYTMTIQAACDRVFPMLCPVREHDYLEDWNAEILYSQSGVAEPGCVFQTPNDTGAPSTWYIAEHDPDTGRILFVIFTPASRVSRLDVTVNAKGAEAAAVTLTYTHTAIAPAGREFIAAFTEDAFTAKMRNFEAKLNECLARAEATERSG